MLIGLDLSFVEIEAMARKRNPLTLKTRWRMFYSKFTAPVLLARFDEKKVVAVTTAVNGSLAILLIGLFAWLTDLPLVFPALGPSAFILFSSPLSAAAAPRSVIMGHFVCLGVGTGVWHIASYLAGSGISYENHDWPLFVSATVAMAIVCWLMVRLACPHPPACASCLVVAIGAVTNSVDIVMMFGVLVWLTCQATIMNRLAGLPVPLWRIKGV